MACNKRYEGRKYKQNEHHEDPGEGDGLLETVWTAKIVAGHGITMAVAEEDSLP